MEPQSIYSNPVAWLHSFFIYYWTQKLLSVLCCCWLDDRKGIQPVRKLSGGMLAWLCVWVKVLICIWPCWCHCHSLSLAPVNPDWFYLSGAGSPGYSRTKSKRAIKWLRVCEFVCLCDYITGFLLCSCFSVYAAWICSRKCEALHITQKRFQHNTRTQSHWLPENWHNEIWLCRGFKWQTDYTLDGCMSKHHGESRNNGQRELIKLCSI